MSYNFLAGSFPSWVSNENNLELYVAAMHNILVFVLSSHEFVSAFGALEMIFQEIIDFTFIVTVKQENSW